MGTLSYLLPCLFILSVNAGQYDEPNTLPDRQTMVHLFEWKWTDIAAECENFLQYYGYGAVQVSPPNEHITFVQNDDMPWYIRYQPVSYKLSSRSGNEEQFKDMVNRCNKVGVRIIVDVVINHMVGVGQKKDVNGRGSTGGSFFDGTEGVESFPGVPYSKSDFNDYKCKGNIEGDDYGSNAEKVRNCRLVGLLDLDHSNDYVRGKLIGYFNHLIDLGVAGFRIDASKHMWPGDLEAIQRGTKNLREDIFGSNKRPFIVHEVIDRGGEAVKCAEYTGIGRYTNFNYGPVVSGAARGHVDWANLRYLQQGYGYGNHADNDVVNFIDNHDNQRGGDVLNYKHGDQYKRAVAFMLAWTYGYPRVMSSYYFNNNEQGPPNAGSKSGYATKSPSFNQDLTCNSSSGWVCEHRWPTTREMAKFRSAVAGTFASEIVTGYKQLAFAREGKGFFAVNGNGGSWRRTFQTSLPSGQYCDVWSGYLKDGKCTGKTITVYYGYADIDVTDIVAISVVSKVDRPSPSPHPTLSPQPLPPGYAKTVILLKKDTAMGEYVFLRGGTSHAHGGACSPGPYQQASDPCAVPIKHNTTAPPSFLEYRAFSQNDNYLDWEGAEKNQGSFRGTAASGTPLVWSTSDPSDVAYQEYNKYGRNFWMVELIMDCSKTENGWFEVKGFITPSGGWEPDVNQETCLGILGNSAPFKSNNHIARCGSVNVFFWGSSQCIIDLL